MGEHHIIEIILLELEDFPVAEEVLTADNIQKFGEQFKDTMERQLAVL